MTLREIYEKYKDNLTFEEKYYIEETIFLLDDLASELDMTTIDIGNPENGDSETYVDTKGKVLIGRHSASMLTSLKLELKNKRQH